jgi:2-oxo-4-hydroxy-4-carboxy--5-ureidoimidazoline (OHCU) decarboxylase
MSEMSNFRKKAARLHERIRSGDADPISDREREQLEAIRTAYVRRFGEDPVSKRGPGLVRPGQPDPISDREREQLKDLRAAYVRRFGKDPSKR